MYGSTNRKLPIKVHRVIIFPNSANNEEVTWFNLDLVIGQLSSFCIFVSCYWPTFLYFDLIYKTLTYKEQYHVSIFFIKPMENHKKFCKIVWLLISYIISWHDTINVPLFKFWWLIFHGFGPNRNQTKYSRNICPNLFSSQSLTRNKRNFNTFQ